MSQASSEARGASREAHSEAQKHRQDGAHRRQRFKGWLRDLRRLAGSRRKPARPQKRLQRKRAAEGFQVVCGGPQTAKGVALSALSGPRLIDYWVCVPSGGPGEVGGRD